MDEREKRRIEKERREKEQQRIFVEGLTVHTPPESGVLRTITRLAEQHRVNSNL